MPTPFAGKDFLIQRYISPGVFETVAYMKSTSLTVNNEQVDVTSKSSVPWRQLFQAGIRSMDLSLAGIFTDDTSANRMMADVMAGTIQQYKVISGRGDIFLGNFLVASVQRSGEYNNVEQYTMSLASAGAITFTAGP